MGPDSRGVGPAALRVLARVVEVAALLALTSVADAADAPPPQTFDEVIAALEKADPGSPEVLSDRLEYAGQLVDAVEADCQQHLDTAQSQLDTVARSPATDVVLPNGRARIADIQYRLKLARGSCGTGPAERESDLREALTAARQAVGLYRDALDYQSMAIMQFNVGVTQRMLGDHEAAVASLESAVAMDREYGFRQDAEDNSKLLAVWNGPANTAGGADPVTVPTVIITAQPTRSVALKFAWVAHEATLGVKVDQVVVADDSVIHGSASRFFKQRVYSSGSGGWVVSCEPGQIAYDLAAWPSEPREVHDLAYTFGAALASPGFQVTAQGDFKRVLDLSRVASKQTAAMRDLILGRTQSAAGAAHLPAAAVSVTKPVFGPDEVEEHAEEDYDFETGVWIGAILEQGVWYNMSGQLILPGTRDLLLLNDVEFAYTRDVPCTSDSTRQPGSCVEIVVHATPQEKLRADLVSYLNRRLTFSHKARGQYWSTTYMRIVLDPNTLTTYVYDVRRYWHGSGDILYSQQPESHFERLVATFTYP